MLWTYAPVRQAAGAGLKIELRSNLIPACVGYYARRLTVIGVIAVTCVVATKVVVI